MAEKEKDSDLPAVADPTKPQAPVESTVVPEVIQAIREERIGQININILLQRVTEQHEDPDAMVARMERTLTLAEKYEESRLKAFKERSNAIIDFKIRDPDEIEKRRNNKARRCLKYSVAAMSILAIGAALVCVWVGGNIVLAGLFGCSGALGLAMLGPMATGESVSSTDIVRIVNAIRGAAEPEAKSNSGSSNTEKPKRKK